MKTLIVLHGGESWDDDADYLDFLKNQYWIAPFEPIDPVLGTGWKDHLCVNAYELGWAVYQPTLPCKHNAKYYEWKVILDRIFALLPDEDEIVLVGHSLGGNLLIKYLAETHNLPISRISLHLVASCYGLGSFSEPTAAGWEQLAQISNIQIWHAKDDPIVPLSDAKYIATHLPSAELNILEYGEHMRIPEFPKLETEIFWGSGQHLHKNNFL
jgi:predicted alpha/beta hydrolase family esterase